MSSIYGHTIEIYLRYLRDYTAVEYVSRSYSDEYRVEENELALLGSGVWIMMIMACSNDITL